MGLGKTLEVIALILHDRWQMEQRRQQRREARLQCAGADDTVVHTDGAQVDEVESTTSTGEGRTADDGEHAPGQPKQEAINLTGEQPLDSPEGASGAASVVDGKAASVAVPPAANRAPPSSAPPSNAFHRLMVHAATSGAGSARPPPSKSGRGMALGSRRPPSQSLSSRGKRPAPALSAHTLAGRATRPRMGLPDESPAAAPTTTPVGRRLIATGGVLRSADDSVDDDGGTLVVCPMSLISQWTDELSHRAGAREGASCGAGGLQLIVYHGMNRMELPPMLSAKMIVIASYGTLAAEWAALSGQGSSGTGGGGGGGGSGGGSGNGGTAGRRRASGGGGGGGLLRVAWRRVVLDEAHEIRNHNSQTARAAFALRAERRWVVTGTPLQNRLAELFSPLHFLRIVEIARTHARWSAALAPPNQPIAVLRRHLRPLLLRRTKGTRDVNGEPIVQLPPRTVRTLYVALSKEEQDFYSTLHSRSRAQFEAYVAEGRALTQYSSVLALLLRLRQACDHPFLVLSRSDTTASFGAVARHLGAGSSTARAAAILGRVASAQMTATAAVPCLRSPLTTQTLADGNRPMAGALDVEVAMEAVEAVEAVESAQATEGGLASAVGEAERVDPVTGESATEVPEAQAKPAGTSSAEGKAVCESEDGSGAAHDAARGREECPICLEPPEDAVVTACAHTYCRECILGCIGHGQSTQCPMCREVVTRESLLTLPRANRFAVDLETQWRSSAKLDALIGELTDTLAADEPAEADSDPGPAADGEPAGGRPSGERAPARRRPSGSPWPVKSVVFSQWTAMLDLVEVALRSEPRLGYCRLDGGMTSDERQRTLRRFREDPAARILLLSLKAGGVGLNLTTARRVYLLDPWFNPAVEEQAMDRVHRLGQEHPVVVTRFIVRGSVEEKMLQLQERKRATIDAALALGPDGELASSTARGRTNQEEARRLRLRDLALVFGD